MRKLIFIITITILLITLFNACKKNNNPIQPNEDSNTEQQYSDYEWELFHKLQTFKNKIDNPLRTVDFMSRDSVVWYLEALLNTTQVFSDSSFTILLTDSSNYVLPVNDSGYISMNDISTVHGQMIDTLMYQLSIINYDGKFVYLTDVMETNSSSSNLSITLQGIYGAREINALYLYKDFTDIDDWYYGNMLGRSDGAFLWESDAGLELERRLNNPIYSWAPGTSWLNVTGNKYAPYHDFPTTSNPYGAYRIFFDDISTTNAILLNEHLDYYLNEAHWIIHTVDDPNTSEKEGIRPSMDLSFKVVDVKTSNPNSTPYFHFYNAKYGEPYLLPPFE